MTSTESWTLGLPAVDIVVIAACLLGLLAGALAGLGRSFSLLLWLLVALFLGHHLSERVASWLPNSVEPGDERAVLVTFAVLAGVVMAVPVISRVFGGVSGKKKEDAPPRTHKPFGALVGLLVAVLSVTVVLPFLEAQRDAAVAERDAAREENAAARTDLAKAAADAEV